MTKDSRSGAPTPARIVAAHATSALAAPSVHLPDRALPVTTTGVTTPA